MMWNCIALVAIVKSYPVLILNNGFVLPFVIPATNYLHCFALNKMALLLSIWAFIYCYFVLSLCSCCLLHSSGSSPVDNLKSVRDVHPFSPCKPLTLLSSVQPLKSLGWNAWTEVVVGRSETQVVRFLFGKSFDKSDWSWRNNSNNHNNATTITGSTVQIETETRAKSNNMRRMHIPINFVAHTRW